MQPDLDNHFLLRMAAASGQLVTDIPEGDGANFVRVSRTKANQLIFLLGYPLMFLYYLHLATERDGKSANKCGDTQSGAAATYIDTAEKILKFIMSCNDSLYEFFLSHKAAVGAALVFKATGKAEYRRVSEKIVDHLLKLQCDSGDFMKDYGLPPIVRFDQSTEIAIWFRELANHAF
jgi:hypothetical protein